MSTTADSWLATTIVTLPPEPVVKKFKLAPFYRKFVDVMGIPIIASEKVSDAAVLEAGYLAHQMLQHRPQVARELAKKRVRVAVMAVSELTSVLPEHSDLPDFDRRARGLGATMGRPASSCAEENLLGCPGDPYAKESIFIHEFAHTMHTLGLPEEFDRRVKASYDRAMRMGLWRGTYAAENHLEYWAEGVQSYFGCNWPERDPSHNGVNGRAALAGHDPELFGLVREVYGDAGWEYVPAIKRVTQPHLKTVDRTKLPAFKFPD
jgi:hypothetical protein